MSEESVIDKFNESLEKWKRGDQQVVECTAPPTSSADLQKRVLRGIRLPGEGDLNGYYSGGRPATPRVESVGAIAAVNDIDYERAWANRLD